MEWDDELNEMRPFPGVASGGYMVEVMGGKHYSTPAGDFVEMGHGKHYSLRIVNSTRYRCKLQITVDGTSVGTFRIDDKSEYEIERPVDKPLKFTFFRVGFAPGGSGIKSGRSENGLIACTFTPELGSSPAKIYVSAPTLKGSSGFIFSISDQAPASELIQTIKKLTKDKFNSQIPSKCKNTVMVQWTGDDASCTPLGQMPEDIDMAQVASAHVHDSQENYFSLLHLESVQITHKGATLDFDLDNSEPTCDNIFQAVLRHREWGLKEDQINLVALSTGRVLFLYSSAKTVFGQRHIYLTLTKEEATQYNGRVKLMIQPEISKQAMNLTVKTLTGKDVHIRDMLPYQSIFDVKLKLQELEGIPPNQQRLIFGGKLLEETKSSAYYSICDGSVLHLVCRFRGGGYMSQRDTKRDNLCAVGDHAGNDAENLPGTTASSEKTVLNARDPTWRAGATTLQGASSQKFLTVPALRVDSSLAVTLSMRLVARSDEQVDLTQYEDLKCSPLSTLVPDSVPE